MRMGKDNGVPRLRAILVHAAPTLIDGTIIPAGLFWAALHTLGLHAAVWAGLAWSGGAVGRRVGRGRRVPGVVLLSAIAVVGRAATMVATGSAFLYFLQPVIGTMLTGVLFLVSVPLGRPLTERLAADFVPLGPETFARPAVHRGLQRLSVFWGAVHLANAGLTLFLLQREPVATFVLLRPAVSVSTTGVGILVTFVAARRVLGSPERRPGAAASGETALPAALQGALPAAAA